MIAPIILIDASSYFFRAFHALPPLKNSKGQATGAIYGVANMIKKLIKDYQPSQLAVIFDASGKTFREELYPAYKAHRPSMPDDLRSQFHPLLALLQSMGLPLFMVEGVEADDVIGTLAKQASDQGLSVVISTGDKDLAQLVNERVSLINTMTNFKMDIEGVKTKFGVAPAQMIDYLTLVGDSTDNIPGVPQCGPKTAVKWLEAYGNLDNLILHAQEITGKIGESLRASLTHLPLSKQLVTIKTDVPLSFQLEDLKPKPVQSVTLLELVREYEFKHWLKELLEDEGQPIPDRPQQQSIYQIITTETALESWIQQVKASKLLYMHLAATHQEFMQAELLGLTLAAEDKEPVYIACHTNQKQLLTALKPLLENPDIKKVGSHLKHAYGVLKQYEINLQGMDYDIMLESYVLNSAGRHDIHSLSLKYLGQNSVSYEDIAGKGAKQIPLNELALEKVASYSTEVLNSIKELHHKLYPMMDATLTKVFKDIEMPLIRVLGDMEREGVLIDSRTLKHHGDRLKERIQQLEQEAFLLAGYPFNLNSPKQLQEIFFETLKLPVLSKTPKGQPSTSESVLVELAVDHRIAAVILEYRSLAKLVSTYIDSLPQKMNPKTHRVHTSYNQAVAATGRLSSSDPNLQNIPIRTEEGRLIRKAFIAPPGSLILAADYSQIELRIMAHLSQDDNLLLAFSKGWDIHQATASEIFQVPLETVSREQRRRAKAINFGLIYGMSAFGLAKQIGVDREEAQHYIDTYFHRYPKVLDYMERTRIQAHQVGYVETLFGRRLYVPEINTQNMMRRKAAERAAINAPMQGTAADIIKKAMLDIAHWQSTLEKPSLKMIMQVHDELVFEVPVDTLESSKKNICELMEHTVSLSVPLIVSAGTGPNWDAAHS